MYYSHRILPIHLKPKKQPISVRQISNSNETKQVLQMTQSVFQFLEDTKHQG
ncbi:hypothetical protein X975_24903, partial [Stegodyphus mimosarum]